MTKKNEEIWQRICGLMLKQIEIKLELQKILGNFTEEELEISLGASNSENLDQTINCFIAYGEDGDKLHAYLDKRKD